MKRLSILSTLAALLMIVGTGCLKDKGFEAGNYGIQIQEVKGVAFPQAKNSPIGYGLDVSASPQVVNSLIYSTIESQTAAVADVVVSLANTSGTNVAGPIASYNAANGTNVIVLTPALWNIPASITIPAGAKNAPVPITITNTTSLDPNATYGIEITMTSATNGYQIAANQSKVMIFFNVKNKYDGRYRLQGYHNRPGLSNPYDEEVHMITSGPSSVYMFWPALGAAAHPLHGGTTYYGDFTANFIFNPATDLMTGWDWTPYATTLPTALNAAPPVSRFDPATRTIYAYFHYNNNPGARAFFDVLTYLGPR